MARCANIDALLLEKTKIDKLLQRIQKRGDDQGKTLTRSILDNAKVAGDRPDSAPQTNGSIKKPALDAVKTSIGNDLRKERQNDMRKPSSEGSKGASSTTAAKVATSSGDPKVPARGPPSDATATKTKLINVAAKPSGFFSSLKSASKRPGTSTKADDTKSRCVASLRVLPHGLLF